MLANWGGVAVFVAATLLAVFLGEKLKINQGILALAFAFFIAMAGGGISPADTIAKCFPSSTMYLLLIVTLFYGFLNESGLTKSLSTHVVWLFRRRPAFIPPATYATAFILSAMGGGGEGTALILSPLFFKFALTMGYDPILAVIACACGACSAAFLFWVGSGAFMIGIVEEFLGHEVAFAAVEGSTIISIMAGILLFLIFYIATRGHRVRIPADIEKPAPLTLQQKKSLGILLGVLFCILVLPLANSLLHSPLLSRAISLLNIRVVMTLGVICCVILRCGDEKTILRKSVPWGLIVMLCGMMTLISLMSHVGTITFIESLLSGTSNIWATVLVLFACTCALGAVTGGVTVTIIICQLIPALVVSTGLSAPLLMCIALCGTNSMFISPYSMGGAMALSGCPEEIKSTVVRKQYVAMVIHAVIMLALTISGLPSVVTQLFF